MQVAAILRPPHIKTAASLRYSLERNHEGGHEPAAICRPCYDHLQEGADLMEAALHMDLKEAAQIVELLYQRRTRRARSVFQRLAPPTPVSISNGICSG
jgi:hypothetical protein